MSKNILFRDSFKGDDLNEAKKILVQVDEYFNTHTQQLKDRGKSLGLNEQEAETAFERARATTKNNMLEALLNIIKKQTNNHN